MLENRVPLKLKNNVTSISVLHFLIRAKLSDLRHFRRDWHCMHYARINCNDLHISCSSADASPQTNQTKPVFVREWIPALNPNKQNLYRYGTECQPNKHPSIYFYSSRSFVFFVQTCDERTLEQKHSCLFQPLYTSCCPSVNWCICLQGSAHL